MAVAALVFFRTFRPPAEPLLECGFHWLTALPCPLCGLTRALCALAQGEWWNAVELHALSPLVFALLLGIAFTGGCRLAGFGFAVPWEYPRFWTTTVSVFAGFGILRILALTL